MGTTLAPLFGGYLILSRSTSGTRLDGAAEMTMAARLADAHSVQLPYLIVAGVLVVPAIVIALFNLPALGTAPPPAAPQARPHPSLLPPPTPVSRRQEDTR